MTLGVIFPTAGAMIVLLPPHVAGWTQDMEEKSPVEKATSQGQGDPLVRDHILLLRLRTSFLLV